MLAAVLGASLTACGGGGGGDPVTSPSTPVPSPAPAPAPAPAAPTGTLWHDDFALDLRSGVQLASLAGGAPTQITTRSDVDVSVWKDGAQYVVTDWDIRGGATAITVTDLASGSTVYQGKADGYVRNVVPSPTNKRLIKVAQGDSPGAAFEENVMDLSTMKPVLRIANDDYFSWMPDGRFMLISLTTGSMRVGSLGSDAVTVVGRLQVPAERLMGQFSVDPTGKRFIMALRLRGSVPAESDVWVGNVDGTGFEQFTAVKALGSALWSPDGRYIAYTVDTGSICSGGGCIGGCDQYYALADLRKVQGMAGLPGSDKFSVRDRSGSTKPLGCTVLAWTP